MATFKPSIVKPTVAVLEQCIPTILISKEAMAKMDLFVDGCADEIGWLGTAYKDKNTIYVSDVLLFKQEVHSTTTEITPAGLTEFGTELLQKPDGVEIWNSIRVWGHSHVNMGTFASAQDDAQMVVFKDNGLDWFLRIIANKKGDIKLDLYDYSLGIIYNNVPWQLAVTQEEYNITNQIQRLEAKLAALNDGLRDTYKDIVDKEIKEKVSKINAYNSYAKGAVIPISSNKYDDSSDYGYKDYYERYGYSSYRDDIDDDYYKQLDKKEDKKKVEEELKKEEEKELFEDYIVDDVVECKDLAEVREVLSQWGFEEDMYTDIEIRNIWEKSFALVGAIVEDEKLVVAEKLN